MTKNAKSTLPKLVRGKKDAARDEGEKVNAKIEAAFVKLARKMRREASRALRRKFDGRSPCNRIRILGTLRLFQEGFMSARTPKSPVRVAFRLGLRDRLFPRLLADFRVQAPAQPSFGVGL